MAGKVIGKTFDIGFPGHVSRGVDDVIESMVNMGAGNIEFGTAVVLDDTKAGVAAFGAGKTADDLVGFAVRIMKTNETYGQDDALYKPKELVDVLKRGSVTVAVDGGTPVMGGAVYLTPQGKVSAAAASNTLIPNAKFKGAKDINNVAEIVLVSRKY